MTISQAPGRKQPSQSPTAFFKMNQQGGARGKPSSVPVKQPSGPMREKVEGK
jgi:hypothetical protein